MNTVLKSGFLALFLLISASMMSKDRDFSLAFGNVTTKTVNFEVLNAKNVSLFIYNDTEGELFSEKLGSDHVAKSYDLQDLSSGTYYLVAESEMRVEKYKISIDKDHMIQLEKTPVTAINKPEYTLSGNFVKLHMSDVKNPVTVSVLDFSNNVYYTAGKNAVEGELLMTFNLDPKTADNYIIRVEENGNTFNKIISFK